MRPRYPTALLPLGCWCAHELEAGPDGDFPVEFLPQLRAGQAGRATTTARARAVCGSTSSEHAHTISFGGRLHQATLPDGIKVLTTRCTTTGSNRGIDQSRVLSS
jgi:hypothetical protein